MAHGLHIFLLLFMHFSSGGDASGNAYPEKQGKAKGYCSAAAAGLRLYFGAKTISRAIPGT